MNSNTTETKKEEQFKDWVREYADLLFSHAVLRGFDHEHARDLVQDTFLSAWKSMDRFEGRASVKNWLFVILKNKITDYYRKTQGRVNILLSQHNTQFDDAGHWAKPFYPKALTIDPAESQDHHDFHTIFESCSGKLNTIQKTVFFMKYMDDLESDDICLQLSLTPNNYWTILHRAKVQLRACLEKNWFLIRNL
ncbi:MAG TPA: sigma-70 family RNA polymerase sigma factor [Ohtaekwangia sp.]